MLHPIIGALQGKGFGPWFLAFSYVPIGLFVLFRHRWAFVLACTAFLRGGLPPTMEAWVVGLACALLQGIYLKRRWSEFREVALLKRKPQIVFVCLLALACKVYVLDGLLRNPTAYLPQVDGTEKKAPGTKLDTTPRGISFEEALREIERMKSK